MFGGDMVTRFHRDTASTSMSSAPFPNSIQQSITCPRAEYDVVNPMYNTLAESELSAKQLVLLGEFQKRVADAGWETTAKCTEILIKFLRARNWDLDKTFAMLSNRQKWIDSYQPHKIDPTSDDFSDLIHQGKMFWYSRDKMNRPVFIFKGGKHYPNSSQNALFFKYLIYCIEYGRSLCPPPPNNQMMLIYDRLNFGLSNYDLALFRQCQEVADYYPETLYKAYICRPNFFLKTIWKVCSAFVDPNILKKLLIIDSLDKLLPDVDKQQLPMSLGGYGLCLPYPKETPVDDDTPKDCLIPNDGHEKLRQEYKSEVDQTIKIVHRLED